MQPRYKIYIIFSCVLFGLLGCKRTHNSNEISYVSVDVNYFKKEICIYFENTGNKKIYLKTSINEFNGLLFVLEKNGDYKRVTTDEFLVKLATSVTSAPEFAVNPNERVQWSIDFDRLVDMEGEKYILDESNTVAVSSFLDASVGDKSGIGIMLYGISYSSDHRLVWNSHH